MNEGYCGKSSNSLVQIKNNIVSGSYINYGIFATSDGGENWKDIAQGLSDSRSQNLVVIDSTLILLTPSHQIYSTTNLGVHWDSLNSPLYTTFLINSGKNLYAEASERLYKSSDFGQNWTICLDSVLVTQVITMKDILFVSYSVPIGWNNFIYGLCYSNDDGVTWIDVNRDFKLALVNSLDKNLFATGFGELYRSTDLGYTWEMVVSGDLSNVSVVRENFLFIHSFQGILFTSDSGESWNISPYIGMLGFITSLTVFNEHLYAGTFGNSVWKRPLNEVTGINEIKPETKSFTLYQNYPNPFNSSTVIKYSLTSPAYVLINIFNALGQKVKVLVDKYENQGSYEVNFDAPFPAEYISTEFRLALFIIPEK